METFQSLGTTADSPFPKRLPFVVVVPRGQPPPLARTHAPGAPAGPRLPTALLLLLLLLLLLPPPPLLPARPLLWPASANAALVTAPASGNITGDEYQARKLLSHRARKGDSPSRPRPSRAGSACPGR
jgi:hypothetical protein